MPGALPALLNPCYIVFDIHINKKYIEYISGVSWYRLFLINTIGRGETGSRGGGKVTEAAGRPSRNSAVDTMLETVTSGDYFKTRFFYGPSQV